VVVGTYCAVTAVRNPEHRCRLAELSRGPLVRRIQLGGLARSDIACLVAMILGEDVSASVLDEIAARGEGNPMFTEELAAARAACETVPQLLSDLLAADIEALDGTASVLRAAAPISAAGRRPHWLRSAHRVADISAEQLNEYSSRRDRRAFRALHATSRTGSSRRP